MMRLRQERGSALIFVLLGLSVLTVLGVGITGLGMASLANAKTERETTEVLAIADAGISHAKKLILWQEWNSFDQFLQNGADPVACGGDELSVQPSAPLPTGYPSNAVDFIPLAGKAYGAGQYVVIVCDDHSTDIDPTTGVLDSNASHDANKRIYVRSTGTAPGGASATIEVVIGAADVPAVIVDGDLDIKGNPTATGGGGSFHANGGLTLTGNPCASQYFSSVNNVNNGSNAEGGATCTTTAADVRPNSEPINLPIILPSDYKSLANFWLRSDGVILQNVSGTWTAVSATGPLALLANWSPQFGGQNYEWRATGDVPPGTYYSDANINITGNMGSSGVATVTFITEGWFAIGGNPSLTPALTVPFRGPIAVIAGTDIALGSSFSNAASGLFYALHQINVAGGPTINGQLVAANRADTPYPTTSGQVNNPVKLNGTRMEITGNPTITFNGNGLVSARMQSWRECRDGSAPSNPCGTP